MTYLPDLPLLFGHTYYGSGNLPGSANQGILGILFLDPILQECRWQSDHEACQLAPWVLFSDMYVPESAHLVCMFCNLNTNT